MSVVLWGARRYDLQAGSTMDRSYAGLQREFSGTPEDRDLFRDASVPLPTRLRGHQLRLAALLRIRKH